MSTDAMREDLDQTVSEAEATLNESKGGAAHDRLEVMYEKARQARDKLNTLMSDLGAKAGETGRAMESSLREGIDHTERKIRERPWTAVGIAAGAGLLLGLLLNRNR